MSTTFFLIYVLVWLLILYYVNFVIKNYRFLKFAWKQNGFIPVLPFLGTAYAGLFSGNLDNVIGAFRYLALKYGYPFIMWHGKNFYYMSKDPAEGKAILQNLSAQNKGAIYDDVSHVFANSLLTIPYEQWKVRRRQYMKSFKPNSLKPYSTSYFKGSCEFIEKLKAKNGNGVSYDFFNKYAFANFFDTSVGMDKRPSGMDRYGECLMMFQEDVARQMVDPVTPPEIWIRFYPGGKHTTKMMKEVSGISDEILREKLKQRTDFKEFVKNEDVPPLLDLMLSLKGTILNDKDIFDDLIFFSAAATDTSGHTMMILFTLIGMHPDAQEKIYEEVMTKIGHEIITSDDLPALEYTEAVILESLRLFPVIPGVVRKLDKDINLGTKVLPKGTNFGFSIFDLHRDEKYWPNPSKFDPTRFLPENADKIHPFSYLAFSTGPRDCLGKAQAMAMLKITVASVLRKFKVTSNHKSHEDFQLSSSLTLKTKHPLDCHFIPRYNRKSFAKTMLNKNS